ncbi:MAG: hypothetical protein HXY43_26185 [Fischerella sp.]|jgi:hypothetical protein|uniref:hypothetical protein n=1 Tax=unclassified Fischerella TaxID=494603 RepID=UPI00047BB412|nr:MULTISPECIES: hypothetical protein [unclassified Fischerella]NWF62625.1 hypothetical protein [Fischerella sp.]
MIYRALDVIFIDFFAFAINTMFGRLLQSKICNYSWEGKDEQLQEDTEFLKPLPFDDVPDPLP